MDRTVFPSPNDLIVLEISPASLLREAVGRAVSPPADVTLSLARLPQVLGHPWNDSPRS